MKNVAIHYFSGTGNTAHAAGLIGDILKESGRKVSLIRIEKGIPFGGDTADFHIFMFPVYAMSVPRIFQNYARRAPKAKGIPCAVISTHGEVSTAHEVPGEPGGSLKQMERILKRRGYRTLFAQSVGYPHNVTIVAPPAKESELPQMILDGDTVIRKIAVSLIAGTIEKRRCGIALNIFSRLFGALYNTLGRRILGKIWMADADCNGCGLCRSACPKGIIRIRRGKPIWGWECEGCMRCQNVCPRHAINVSIPKFALYALFPVLPIALYYFPITRIFFHQGLERFTNCLELPCENYLLFIMFSQHKNALIILQTVIGAASIIAHPILIILLYTLLSFIIVVPCELILTLLSEIEAVRRFLSLTHTKKNRSYLCTGFDAAASVYKGGARKDAGKAFAE